MKRWQVVSGSGKSRVSGVYATLQEALAARAGLAGRLGVHVSRVQVWEHRPGGGRFLLYGQRRVN